MKLPLACALFVVGTSLSLAGQGASGTTAADVADAIRWYDTLGLPDTANLPYVRAATGRWTRTGNQPPENSYLDGFLVSDEPNAFVLFALDVPIWVGGFVDSSVPRASLSVSRHIKEAAGPPHTHVGFKPIDFQRKADDVLARLRESSPHAFYSRPPWIVRARVFAFARACLQRGLDAHGSALMDIAAHLADPSTGAPPIRPLRDMLQQEIGDAAWGEIETTFRDLAMSWLDIAHAYDDFLRRYPASDKATDAAERADLLRQMAAEDAAHRPVPLEQLSPDAQAAEAIYQLRHLRLLGWTTSSPYPFVTEQQDGPDEITPAHRLIDLGDAAVPALIAALDDPRFTRTLPIAFRDTPKVMRVGDVAQRLLEHIAGRPLFSRMTRAQAETWWTERQAKGERQLLIEQAAAGGPQSQSAVRRIVEKYPDAALDAIATGIRVAANDFARGDLVALAAGLQGDAIIAFLHSQLQPAAGVPSQVAAATILAERDDPAAIPAVITAWNDIQPRFQTHQADAYNEAGRLIRFLATIGDAGAVDALARDLHGTPVDVRLAVVRTFLPWPRSSGSFATGSTVSLGPSTDAVRTSDAATEAAIERLLVASLEDAERRVGMKGHWDEASFEDPRVRDMAAFALSKRWPAKYQFRWSADAAECDAQIDVIRETWRNATNAAGGLEARPASSQTTVAPPAEPAPVTLTLRLSGGRRQFRPGERIPFELSFESAISNRFVVDGGTYDRSGRLTIDDLRLTPLDGVRDPMLDFFASSGGFMGGGIRGIGRLGERPFVVALDLNDWFQFDMPGTYELSVRSRRVTEDGPAQPESGSYTSIVAPVDSNTVSFEILPRDEAWEAAELARGAQSIASPTGPADRTGCRALRLLGTRDAVDAMVRHLEDQAWGCGFDFTIGLYAAPDRQHVVDRLEEGLRASDVVVGRTYLRTLAVLSIYLEHPELLPPHTPETMGKQESGPLARRTDLIDAAQARYTRALISALPAKAGPTRAATLAELWEGTLSRAADAGPAPGAATIRQQFVASFADLPIERQQRALEYLWRGLAHPDLIPIMRRLADGSGALADLALRRLYELDPVDGRTRILREIQNPRQDASQLTLGLLPDRVLPELDEVLARNVETTPEDVRLWLVHRYATPVVALRMLATLASRVGAMACQPQSYFLAYALRASPEEGAALLNQALAARERTACYQNVLSDVSALYMAPAIEAAALARLDDGNPHVVASAIETLGRRGSAAAQRPLREHFERWHREWDGRQDELRFSFAQERPHAMQANVEIGYLRALGSGQAWLTGLETIAELRSLCVTDRCRSSADSMAADADKRTIRVSSLDGPAGPLLYVAQYSLTSMDALKQKLTQFATGTTFTLNVAALYPETRAEVTADLTAFADAEGIEIVP